MNKKTAFGHGHEIPPDQEQNFFVSGHVAG